MGTTGLYCLWLLESRLEGLPGFAVEEGCLGGEGQGGGSCLLLGSSEPKNNWETLRALWTPNVLSRFTSPTNWLVWDWFTALFSPLVRRAKSPLGFPALTLHGHGLANLLNAAVARTQARREQRARRVSSGLPTVQLRAEYSRGTEIARVALSLPGLHVPARVDTLGQFRPPHTPITPCNTQLQQQ